MEKMPEVKLGSPYLAALRDKEIRMRQSWNRAAIWLVGLVVVGLTSVILIGELDRHFLKVGEFISGTLKARSVPDVVFPILVIFLAAVLILIVIQVSALVLVWWERKVAGHMQGRLGPMDVGGWHGWAQTLADGIKLFLKEIIEPEGVNRWVYRLAPFVAFLPAYVVFAPIPFGRGLVALDFDSGLIFVLAISGLSSVGLLMAGWASANKYSILGGLRAAAQMVSYEVPRVFSLIPVIMWSQTLNLNRIADLQSVYLWGWFPRWFVFYPFVGQIAFLIYMITTVAETNRVPFDIPEAESELIGGFHTEYGGIKFAFFFLAEYAYVFAGSLLGVVLFLGGGAPPFPGLQFIPSWAWFLGKAAALVFIFLWARWTLPRLRVDRVMDLCWKIFIPWTLVNMGLYALISLGYQALRKMWGLS